MQWASNRSVILSIGLPFQALTKHVYDQRDFRLDNRSLTWDSDLKSSRRSKIGNRVTFATYYFPELVDPYCLCFVKTYTSFNVKIVFGSSIQCWHIVTYQWRHNIGCWIFFQNIMWIFQIILEGVTEIIWNFIIVCSFEWRRIDKNVTYVFCWFFVLHGTFTKKVVCTL